METKKWFKVNEKITELNDLRNKGHLKGWSIGWGFDSLPITIKEGCTSYVAGAPHDGKTEFWLEILINLSVKYKIRHAIFTPETGTIEDVISELCFKYIGKPYIKTQDNPMTEAERICAEMFVDEYFYIIDPLDDKMTADDFYKIVDDIEINEGKRIHTTMIDPFNELSHDFSKDEGRQDLYIERILGDVRKNARKTNRHNCVITHVRDQAPITANDVTFFPMATAREIAGGQAWFRKGLLMIIIWRPPYGLNDENGIAYQKNEVKIRVVKSKPKGVSVNGTYTMFYDVLKNAYYMRGNQYSKRHKNLIREEQAELKINVPKPVNWFDTEKDEDFL
jgi:hypothetical protein